MPMRLYYPRLHIATIYIVRWCIPLRRHYLLRNQNECLHPKGARVIGQGDGAILRLTRGEVVICAQTRSLSRCDENI